MPTIDIKELNKKEKVYQRIRRKYKVRIDTLNDLYFNNNDVNKWCLIPKAWVKDCERGYNVTRKTKTSDRE